MFSILYSQLLMIPLATLCTINISIGQNRQNKTVEHIVPPSIKLSRNNKLQIIECSLGDQKTAKQELKNKLNYINSWQIALKNWPSNYPKEHKLNPFSTIVVMSHFRVWNKVMWQNLWKMWIASESCPQATFNEIQMSTAALSSFNLNM